MFGNSIILNAALTGISSIELVLVSKDSDYVKAELNSKDGFTLTYKRFDYELLPS